MPIEIGGRAVAIATPAGAEPVSTAAPEVMAIYRAGMSDTHRLVGAFLSRADIARVRSGAQFDGVVYQVQVGSAFADTHIPASDWAELRPLLAREVAGLDIRTLISETESGVNSRLSTATGSDIRIEFGAIGQPKVYGDHPDSVRFHTLMPVTMMVAGEPVALELQTAAAALPLNGRLVFLYAIRRHRSGEDASAVHGALDRWVEATVAANPR